jgi:hypothetical protein
MSCFRFPCAMTTGGVCAPCGINPYVPVMDRGPQDTLTSENARLLDVIAAQERELLAAREDARRWRWVRAECERGIRATMLPHSAAELDRIADAALKGDGHG